MGGRSGSRRASFVQPRRNQLHAGASRPGRGRGAPLLRHPRNRATARGRGCTVARVRDPGRNPPPPIRWLRRAGSAQVTRKATVGRCWRLQASCKTWCWAEPTRNQPRPAGMRVGAGTFRGRWRADTCHRLMVVATDAIARPTVAGTRRYTHTRTPLMAMRVCVGVRVPSAVAGAATETLRAVAGGLETSEAGAGRTSHQPRHRGADVLC